MSDEVYDVFLRTMRDLERFRVDYLAEHRGPGLERDDPDLRRLMESLAYVSARTHISSSRQLHALQADTTRRLFPALSSPVPAMGVVRALPNRRLYESSVIPSGSTVVLSDKGQEANFMTMADLKILPLTQGSLSRTLLPNGNTRWTLPFSGPFPRHEELGEFPLFINYVDDFHASVRVFEALRQNVVSAHVEFSGGDLDTNETVKATVSFDGWHSDVAKVAGSTIEAERWWFQLPQQDLVFKIQVPETPAGWQSFAIHFEIGQGWPRDLHLSSELFIPFATPIVNLTRSYAEPVLWDGTSDAFVLRHRAGRDYKLHSLRGVYRVDDGAMIPMHNGAFVAEGGSYLLQEEQRAGIQGCFQLSLNLPEAFMAPVTIATDATWYQPDFSRGLSRRQTVSLAGKRVAGTTWQVVGDMVAHQFQKIGEGDEATELFVLNNKSFFVKEELIMLLDLLGTTWSGHFADLRDAIAEVRVERQPMHKEGDSSASMIVYHVVFRDPSDKLQPLAKLFSAHLQSFLGEWCSGGAISVQTEFVT